MSQTQNLRLRYNGPVSQFFLIQILKLDIQLSTQDFLPIFLAAGSFFNHDLKLEEEWWAEGSGTVRCDVTFDAV